MMSIQKVAEDITLRATLMRIKRKAPLAIAFSVTTIGLTI
jgi:hypothetical protein